MYRFQVLVRLATWSKELSFRIVNITTSNISFEVVLVKGEERTKGEFVVFPIDIYRIMGTSSRVPVERSEDTIFVEDDHLSTYFGIDIFVDR